MPSAALLAWMNDGGERLDELVKVHEAVAGVAPGRKFGTEQLNRSLFIALVAQFQRYCVGLHSLAVSVHVAAAQPEQQEVIRRLMTVGRSLDSKNPRTDHLGADFSRLGLTLIQDLKDRGPATTARLRNLDLLVDFRNALAHGNEAEIAALAGDHGIKPTKSDFVRYRGFVNQLAPSIDDAVSKGLASLLLIQTPW